jgi:hypothetical protein
MVPTAELLAKTTSQFVPLTSLTPLGDRKIPADAPHGIQESDTTNQILANELSRDPGAGFYLISISGISQRYLYDDKLDLAISGIVSKQYNASDLIVGFGDSSITYVHQGMPKKLSNIRIRILDPKTKQVATDLGPNNTVLLQITRGE